MHVLLKIASWLLAFAIGASFGSFYRAAGDRVLLYFYGPYRKRPRSQRWREFFTRRSFCYGCGRQLRIPEIIPVAGWFFSRGRCSSCGESVSIVHPLVEFGFGLLAVLSLEMTGSLWAMILLLLVCGHLLIAMMTDLRHLSLDHENTGMMLVVSLLFVSLTRGPSSLLDHALSGLGVFAFFLLALIVSRGRQPGVGDILLGGVLGFLHGFPWILFPLQIGAAGSLIHIWLVRKDLRSAAPLGFYMALGSVITLVFTVAFRP